MNAPLQQLASVSGSWPSWDTTTRWRTGSHDGSLDFVPLWAGAERFQLKLEPSRTFKASKPDCQSKTFFELRSLSTGTFESYVT